MIHVCCLQPDIDNFNVGDLAEIGERGITLSGNQRIVPVLHSGHCKRSTLAECNYAILVRQPCMWTGGIQLGRVFLTQPIGDNGTDLDVNASLRLPLSLCTSTGADFNEDEITLFRMLGYKAEMECSAFSWDHSKYSPYESADFNHMVSRDSDIVVNKVKITALCITICWTDRLRGVKATPVHTKWMTSKNLVVQMKKRPQSGRALALQDMDSMKIACSKSSSQSNVSASTCRSKIGSNRVLFSYSGLSMANTWRGIHEYHDSVIINTNKQHGWFGNSSIRAVSKLCSSVMQLTLKVKSSNSVENLSPTLSLMSGSDSCPLSAPPICPHKQY
eukprot:15365239-Ditylum_brightwellii.AAC.1